jgi:hypothetical protein
MWHAWERNGKFIGFGEKVCRTKTTRETQTRQGGKDTIKMNIGEIG